MEKILKEKERQELEQLVYLAKSQGNIINANLVYMTINLNSVNYDVVVKYFDEQGITMIHEDVEPDITAYSCEGEKMRPFDLYYVL